MHAYRNTTLFSCRKGSGKDGADGSGVFSGLAKIKVNGMKSSSMQRITMMCRKAYPHKGTDKTIQSTEE